jgi:peptidoglycan/LPS O-acetylase OafA/YrhL
MALGWWYQRAPEVTERRLFGAPALIGGAVLYALGLASYGSIETYVATDALLCCGLFLLLAHLARALAARPRLGAALATIGVYSYGLYLIHQPYVIELAIRVREWTMPAAVAAGLAAVAVLTILSMLLERVVNRATARFFAAPR